MKGILLSLVSFLLLCVASFFSIRAYRGTKYFHIFLIEFPFVCLLYSLLFYFLPDPAFPSPFLEPSRAVDFINGFILLALLFHLMWDLAYAVILTGFSSEMIVRMWIQRKKGLLLKEFIEEFGGNEEIDNVLAWRIPNLLGKKYIAWEGSRLCLLKKGRRVVQLAYFLKKLFKMDLEG